MATTTPTAPDHLLHRLAEFSAKTPKKVALSFLKDSHGKFGGQIERELTYLEVQRSATALCRTLLDKKGLRAGDRVVLVYPPSLDFTVAFLACLMGGIVAVPVFPPNPSRRETLVMFSHIVENSGSKHALTSSSYHQATQLAGLKDAFVAGLRKGGKPNGTVGKWPDRLKWIVTTDSSSSSTTTGKNSSPSPPQFDNDAVAFLQYTSGSTSEPKGVMITHGNLSHNLRMIVTELQAGPDTRVVSWLPQYHDMGLIGSYLGTLYCGGSGWYMSPLTFLARPILWLEAVSAHRATHVQAPNFAYRLAVRKFDLSILEKQQQKFDLSSLVHMINAAEPVDAPTLVSFIETFEPYGLQGGALYPTYGIAEHTVFVCSGGQLVLEVDRVALETQGVVNVLAFSDTAKPSLTKARSEHHTVVVGCGYPHKQGVDVRIVDCSDSSLEAGDSDSGNTFRDLGEDRVGEIWVRSDCVAAGYYQRPDEENDGIFRAHLTSTSEEDVSDSSGTYLRTGDLGFLHDRELFVTGRLKDLIIVGGRNHYPQDIEGTAEESAPTLLRPGCTAAFAVTATDLSSSDDGENAERVALIAELREAPPASSAHTVCGPLASSLRASIKQQHSIDLAVVVLLKPRTVPKTTSGKIARAWCRRALRDGKLQAVHTQRFAVGGTDDPSTVHANGRTVVNPLEIDSSPIHSPTPSRLSVEAVRTMNRNDLADMLTKDICAQGGLASLDDIDRDAPLTACLDSLSLMQFKSQLEFKYYVNNPPLSNEYLLRDTTTVRKLCEVVATGYAPDDVQNGDVSTNNTNTKKKTLSEHMNCPPGVYCVVM